MNKKYKAIIEIKKEDTDFPVTMHELSVLILKYDRRKKLNKINQDGRSKTIGGV